MRRRTSLGLVAATTLFGHATRAVAAPPVYQRSGYAIEGYDAVAYFTNPKAIKGLTAFTARWRDATWLFVSAENRSAFRANPERYAPQYGGHCAMSMAGGKKVSADPEAWRVEREKLYLNSSVKVRDSWLLRMDQYIKEADWWWQRSYAT